MQTPHRAGRVVVGDHVLGDSGIYAECSKLLGIVQTGEKPVSIRDQLGLYEEYAI